MLKEIKCFILPKKFLKALSDNGTDFDSIFNSESAKDILSEGDFLKYDSYKMPIAVDYPGESSDLVCSPDDIEHIGYPDANHFDIHDDDSSDPDIFEDSFEEDVLTAPVFFQKTPGGVILVSLKQFKNDVKSRLEFSSCWSDFYSELINLKIPLAVISKNKTFNHYINMTTGI